MVGEAVRIRNWKIGKVQGSYSLHCFKFIYFFKVSTKRKFNEWENEKSFLESFCLFPLLRWYDGFGHTSSLFFVSFWSWQNLIIIESYKIVLTRSPAKNLVKTILPFFLSHHATFERIRSKQKGERNCKIVKKSKKEMELFYEPAIEIFPHRAIFYHNATQLTAGNETSTRLSPYAMQWGSEMLRHILVFLAFMEKKRSEILF